MSKAIDQARSLEEFVDLATPEDLDEFVFAIIAIYGTASSKKGLSEVEERLGRLVERFPDIELTDRMLACLSRIGLIERIGDHTSIINFNDEKIWDIVAKAEKYAAWAEERKRDDKPST